MFYRSNATPMVLVALIVLASVGFGLWVGQWYDMDMALRRSERPVASPFVVVNVVVPTPAPTATREPTVTPEPTVAPTSTPNPFADLPLCDDEDTPPLAECSPYRFETPTPEPTETPIPICTEDDYKSNLILSSPCRKPDPEGTVVPTHTPTPMPPTPVPYVGGGADSNSP